MQKASRHINGIRNQTGCTCYIASSINLLFHGIPKLRDALINLLIKTLDAGEEKEEDTNKLDGHHETVDMEFLLQLSRLFLSMIENSSGSIVDATSFYQTLRDWNGLPLNLNRQGDAASMMSLIISRITNTVQSEFINNNDNRIIQSGLLESLQELEGSTTQTITGEFLVYGDGHPTKRRNRIQNPRTFRGPFPVTVVGNNTLVDALAATTILPQPVERFQWSSGCDDDHGEWITHRTARFHKTPQHLIFHLKRFHFCDMDYETEEENLVTKDLHYLDIPLTLDIAEFANSNSDESYQRHEMIYSLQGVICHAGKKSNDGHYISLINGSVAADNQYAKTDSDTWFVIDDEFVSQIDSVELSSYINGGDSSRLYDDDAEMPLCAMVLLYSRIQSDLQNSV